MKNLVICTVLATLAAAVLCQPTPNPEMQKQFQECLQETGATEDQIKTFFMNGMKPADATDKVKCHIKCMMEKQQHLKDGVFNDQAAVSTLKGLPQLKGREADVEKAIAACKNEKGANDCDTAYKITMCLKENKHGAS